MKCIYLFAFLSIFIVGCQGAQSVNEEMGSHTETIQTTAESEQKITHQYQSDEIDSPIIKDNREGIIPIKVSIPSINVSADIEKVGLLDNGQMGVPEKFEQVGWYKEGILPGEQGNAVLAGHVDSKTGPAIFYHLHKLEVGDEVHVMNEDGEKLTFIVYDKKSFDTESAPVEKIFGYSYRSNLNLITCTGDFNREKGTHEERLVVYTELAKVEKQ